MAINICLQLCVPHHANMEDCVLLPIFVHVWVTGLDHSVNNVSQLV